MDGVSEFLSLLCMFSVTNNSLQQKYTNYVSNSVEMAQSLASLRAALSLRRRKQSSDWFYLLARSSKARRALHTARQERGWQKIEIKAGDLHEFLATNLEAVVVEELLLELLSSVLCFCHVFLLVSN